MVTLIWVAAAAVLAALGWALFNRLGSDRLAVFTERRRATSSMVGRGEFVDGDMHLKVALAVTPSTLFYENAEMQASLDLAWVREIEYDTQLLTGGSVASGKVMRLRSGSRTFEFVIPSESVDGWRTAVPARQPVVT